MLIKKNVSENGNYYAEFRNGLYLEEVILGRNCQLAEEEVNLLLLRFAGRPAVTREPQP